MSESSSTPVAQAHPFDPKYPIINPRPTYDDIRSNFGLKDYLTWGALGGISFPVGYAIGTVNYA